MFRLLTFLLFSTFIIACSGKKEQVSIDWGNFNEHYLNGQQVSLKLPAEFKRSSKFRIASDLPKLQNSKYLGDVVSSAIEQFESTDSNIDVFVDSTSQYRFVTILDSAEKISIDKSSSAQLGKMLMEDYKKMKLSKKGLDVNKLESNIKKNNQQHMAKFKFEIVNKRNKAKTYATTFFITNSTRSLIIHEFSDQLEDLEFYTWSLNENY